MAKHWTERLEENRGRIFLSYGGGVNSKALLFYLIEHGFVPNVDFWAVYADHGGDCPETLRDIDEMNANGFPVMAWPTYVEGHESIFDYYWAKRVIPSVSGQCKDCTHKFKISPLHQAVEWIMKAIAGQGEYVQLIGIDAGEGHRGHQAEHKGIPNIYPFKEDGIDRDGCKEIILRNGQKVPAKSACFFCPNRKAPEWRQLREEHPELFFAAVAMEERNNARRTALGKRPVYLHNSKPLSMVTGEDQGVLLDVFKYSEHTHTILPLPSSDQEYLTWVVEQMVHNHSGIDYYVHKVDMVAEVTAFAALEITVPWEKDVELSDQPITFDLDRATWRTVRAAVKRSIKIYEEKCRARLAAERLARWEEDGTMDMLIEAGLVSRPVPELRLAA